MLDRQQLETFAVVVEHQHFRRAGESLNISTGAVSQRIRTLEEALGVVLLMRGTPVKPTRAGEMLLRHIMALRLLEEDTLQKIRPGHFPAMACAIAVNADSLATWFEAVSWELARQHIRLELVVDDQDHTLAALARGDVMGCISTDCQPLVGFVAEHIGAMAYKCVASPEFAKRHFSGGVTLPASLAAEAILFNRKDTLHDQFLESLFGVRVIRYPRHYFPSSVALLRAIYEGLGYGLVPSMQVDPLLQKERLVDLVPAQTLNIDLYWHHWESEPASSARISQLVMSEARNRLCQSVR